MIQEVYHQPKRKKEGLSEKSDRNLIPYQSHEGSPFDFRGSTHL
jgi:hypothetical protein